LAGKRDIRRQVDIFYLAVEDISQHKPWFLTIKASTGSFEVTQINTDCPLWQMVFDRVSQNLYGINIDNKKTATLIKIDTTTGSSYKIGEFPINPSSKLVRKQNVQAACYDIIGAGIIEDTNKNQLLYYHTTDTGMRVTYIGLSDAKVVETLIYDANIIAPRFGYSDFFNHTNTNLVYGIEIPGDPFSNYFTTLNVVTNKVERQNEVRYKQGLNNFGAIDFDEGLYFTVMFQNATAAKTLIGISLMGGDIYHQWKIPSNIDIHQISALSYD